MPTISFPSIPTARSFPLPAASRIFPPSGGTVSIPVRYYAITTRGAFRSNLSATLFPRFWSTEELDSFINEALRVWNTLTSYFRARLYISIPPGDYSYNRENHLGTFCYIPLKFLLTSAVQPQLELNDLAQFSPQYESSTSTTPSYWVALGLNKFILYPRTTQTVSGYVDVVRYAILPETDADYLQVGEEDVDAIFSFCRFFAALKEGGVELESAMKHLLHFLNQAGKYNSKILKSALYRKALGMAGGGQDDEAPNGARGS